MKQYERRFRIGQEITSSELTFKSSFITVLYPFRVSVAVLRRTPIGYHTFKYVFVSC